MADSCLQHLSMTCHDTEHRVPLQEGLCHSRWRQNSFVHFLYQDPAFDAFDAFSDFVESVSYGSYKTCQVRGSNPCRDRPRPPVCRAGRKTSAKRISRSEVRRVLPAAPARGAPSAHPKFVPWYSVPPILRDGRAAGVEPAISPSRTLSSLEVTRFGAVCSAKI